MAVSELQRKQMEQAEDLLFSGPEKAGFAKDLFLGRFRVSSMLPYPEQSPDDRQRTDESVAEVSAFCDNEIDAAAIDRDADIPKSVISGLGKLGVLGMTVSPQYGGRGLSQAGYCRIMEVLGGHCASTSVLVNAHHSIGLRALEHFGTDEQKTKWLPALTSGEQLAAFALTEADAGSDAANVQTRAEPMADGSGYVLSGQKRYITNGSIADVLTVMARTPDPEIPEGRVTAFLVTPSMDGFEVVTERLEKCGIRGTATAELAFHDMFVPQENVLGSVGKGLRVALTVLDFGRTTFGASCTGAAKACLRMATQHASNREQFGRHLSDFELVKRKIAYAAAATYAMESATYHTAAVIDSGAEDYMLETAMLKVFASDALWEIVNDTLQIHGGAGYFSTLPIERMMRDARINLIGEGANDVLRSFIAMVGLRGVGNELQEVRRKFWKVGKLWRTAPAVPLKQIMLQSAARNLGQQIAKLSRASAGALLRHGHNILDRQYLQARIADIATELFVASCVYSRLRTTLSDQSAVERDVQAGLLYLKTAFRRNRQRFAALTNNNDDEDVTRTANLWLGRSDAHH